ncbi:hypothetical protein EVAR_94738_1 [Eumeta japonica]|uniref:Pre-C2HC domain-containing protein n=2 Tax=Eumeta variegata TaxID=151549 RepID=A0A4C1UVU5_EUMVA|nr:hypothetical protein EVAR_94738_1 [Eumeta japonica]
MTVKFHPYALEEERKLKALIRGSPANFNTEEIKTGRQSQGFPVDSIHRIFERDGFPLRLILAILPKTNEARLIFRNLSKLCGLSGIRRSHVGKEAQANITTVSALGMRPRNVTRILGSHGQLQRMPESTKSSSVRSPAPNGRYRAPAPSALTKLFAFVQIAAPRPSGPADRESNRWLPNGVNEAICSEPWRWPFPFRERQTRTDLGPPALRVLLADTRCRPPTLHNPHSILRTRLLAEHPIVCSHTCPSSSENSAGRPRRLLFAPTNNRRLIRHLRNNRQLYDQTRTPTMDQDSPCSPGAGGSGPKTPITLEFIQQVLTKALSEIGYEAPQDVVKKLIARVTPVSSRASSRATSPMKTNKNKNKRQASSSSDEGATCSDSTVVGSDSESENSNTSFTLRG